MGGSDLTAADGIDARVRALVVHILQLAGGDIPTAPLALAGDTLDAIAVALNLMTEKAAVDAVERRETDRRLHDIRDAYEHAADLLCSVGADGRLIRVNQTLATAVRAQPAVLVGRPLVDLFEEACRGDVDRAVAAIRRGERPAPVDLEIRTPEQPLVVRMHGNVVADDAPHAVPRVRLAFRDITGERSLENQLLNAQKLESLGRLAGGVAHDFNNLLFVMRTTVTFLEAKLDAGAAEDLAVFYEAADRAASITRQMLTFARQDVVRSAGVDVQGAIERARPILARLAGERIALELDLDAGPGDGVGVARVDETRLQQVLVNLVVNARDAIDGAGRIRIATHRAVRMLEDGSALDAVRIVVSDTGRGIPVELRASVFEPFFTTKPQGQGTGLGLSTVYGIVRQAGGYIDLDAAEGGGARFTIDFPVHARVAPTPAASHPPLDALGAGQGKILVLEDDDRVRAIAVRVLRGAGYVVAEAHDRDTALAAVSTTAFDIIVADVILQHTTGPAVIDELRAAGHAPAVIFVSGFARDALGPSHVDDAFLPKPYVPAQLLRAVRDALQARQRSLSAPRG